MVQLKRNGYLLEKKGDRAGLIKKTGRGIPDVLFYDDQTYVYPFMIQEWVEGRNLYDVIRESPGGDHEKIGSDIGVKLAAIHFNKTAVEGFFDRELKPVGGIDLAAHIRECIEAGNAGRKMGKDMTRRCRHLRKNSVIFLRIRKARCLSTRN
jgi:hypothetical protein